MNVEIAGVPQIPEAPKKRSRTRLVIVILVIAIVVVAVGVVLYAQIIPKGETPSLQLTETYSKYGFSVKYPEDMTITEEGLIDATANDNSGVVTGKLFGPLREIAVSWVIKSSPPSKGDLQDAVDSSFGQDNYQKTGTMVESTKSGHVMVYQQGTYTQGTLTEHLVFGAWYCNTDEKVYIFGYGQTTEQDLVQIFQQYLDSFVCH